MQKKKASIVLRKEFFPNEKLAMLYKQTSVKVLKNTMRNTHAIPSKVYHYTRKENLESILAEGLKSGLDGGVFVSTSLEENMSHLINNVIEVDGFINPFSQKVVPNNEKIEDYVIIEGMPVNTYRKNWMTYIDKSSDNNYTLFYLGEILKLDNIKIHEAINL